jgi:hypothetical protein
VLYFPMSAMASSPLYPGRGLKTKGHGTNA